MAEPVDAEVVVPSNELSPPSARPRGQQDAFRILEDVEVELSLEIGRRKMRIADLMRLSTGQTIELSKAAGEPIDVYVNGRLMGRGEAVVVGDRYGIRITELVSPNLRERP